MADNPRRREFRTAVKTLTGILELVCANSAGQQIPDLGVAEGEIATEGRVVVDLVAELVLPAIDLGLANSGVEHTRGRAARPEEDDRIELLL